MQGNTDERGSREYNLALGQRRADAVKYAHDAVRSKGSADRIRQPRAKRSRGQRDTMRLPGQKTAASIFAIRANNGAVARFWIIVVPVWLVVPAMQAIRRRRSAQADRRSSRW